MLPKQTLRKICWFVYIICWVIHKSFMKGSVLLSEGLSWDLLIIGESTNDTVLTSCSSLSPAGSWLLFVSRDGWLQTNPRLVSPTSNVIAVHRYCTRILHFLYCLLAFHNGAEILDVSK